MLLRFDPFRDADRLFDGLRAQPGPASIPMDVYRRDDTLFVHFDLPGVDPSTIDCTLDEDVLTVTAERTWQEKEGDALLCRERPQGTFRRALHLGRNLDLEHLEARYDQGVLTLSLPLMAAARARHLPVRTERTA